MDKSITPQFPLYIPSKGRSQYMITSKVLTELKLKHYIIVEPQEYEDYKRAVEKFKLLTEVLILDLDYKKKYELCDNLGHSKSTGSGPARNFGWDHSIKMGFDRHWMMDDNIIAFLRLNHNEKVKVSTGSTFKAMEDFVLRYKNVSMAGPNYRMFAPARNPLPPFFFNTRIYSCNLIKNDVPFRWRGRYNEDTILSIDMLKKGYCTILFNAFLQDKMTTQKLTGGNTTELYDEKNKNDKNGYSSTGTVAKSNMLLSVHPDVTKISIRFKRYHHSVNYNVFKRNNLIKIDNLSLDNKVNNYGMNLIKKK